MNDVTFGQYMMDRLPELWLRIGEHLMLSGCSTFFAILVGVPLGVSLFRKTWLRNPMMGLINILQTIPSLAMLVILLALLEKIGALPALIALTLYALLPIVRNTLAGLDNVSPELVEAAKGMGMTGVQEFRLVRMPLAMPIILAGIRTAAVVGVGIATLSAFIGAGGLGQFINRGLALSDTRLILLGAVPAALLALFVDLAIGALAWGIQPENKRNCQGTARSVLRIAALGAPVGLILVGILSYTSRSLEEQTGSQQEPQKVIRIGTKNYTEQLILGEMMAQIIESETHWKVDRRFNLGGTMICHGALLNNEIDLYAEYTGTALTAILKKTVVTDPEKVFEVVSKSYKDKFDLVFLKPFGFNNTYAITVRKTDAANNGWQTISDLQKAGPGLRAGFTAEFAERPDGYPGLKDRYDLFFGKLTDLDPALMYEAVSKNEVDVICAFSTDGRIAAYDLLPLKDDQHFFPPYQAAPVVNADLLRNHPEIRQVLLRLQGQLDNKTMQQLNFEVDGKGARPAEVVKQFILTSMP